MRSLQTIFVSRTDKDSRATVAREIERRTKAERGQWHRQLLIFPEGTTTNGSAIITFKVRRRSCVWGGVVSLSIVGRSLARLTQPPTVLTIDPSIPSPTRNTTGGRLCPGHARPACPRPVPQRPDVRPVVGDGRAGPRGDRPQAPLPGRRGAGTAMARCDR